MKHMPIGALSSGPMTTSRALGQDSPAQRLCPKACEARQIVGIDDDVEPYSHAVSLLAAVA